MPATTLYMAPGTCARVPAILLEEAGVAFQTELIRFMKGQHKSPDYKKINPTGKVPALVINGEVFTENVAIITYLNWLFPDAKLMPRTDSPKEMAQQLADLCFCSSTLHPIVTRIRMPHFFASDETAKIVWEKGCDSMNEFFNMIEERLAKQPWWYGETWSAMDAYLSWIYWRVEGANYPTENYPYFSAHQSRTGERPAVEKAIVRETKALAQLEAEGLLFKPKSI